MIIQFPQDRVNGHEIIVEDDERTVEMVKHYQHQQQIERARAKVTQHVRESQRERSLRSRKNARHGRPAHELGRLQENARRAHKLQMYCPVCGEPTERSDGFCYDCRVYKEAWHAGEM